MSNHSNSAEWGLLIFWAPTSLFISVFGQHDLPPCRNLSRAGGPETGPFRRPEPCFGSMMKRNVYFNTWMFPWPGDQWYWWVGCNRSVILGAANFRGWDVETTCHCSFSRSGWDAMRAFVTKTWIKVGSFSLRPCSWAFAWWILLPTPKMSEFFISLKGW